MGKAEWLGLYFCFVCCLDEESFTGCYWWFGDARSCIQVVSFVWVHTIWYSLGLVLWLSRVLELVLPLQTLRDWSLSKDQPRSKLPRGILLEMKGTLLEFQKPVHKNTVEISDSVETLPCLGCSRCWSSSALIGPRFLWQLPSRGHLTSFCSLPGWSGVSFSEEPETNKGTVQSHPCVEAPFHLEMFLLSYVNELRI